MSTVTGEEVEALLRTYPAIFLACHRRHLRDPVSDRELSRNQVDILQHLDPVDPTSVGELADHMGVSISTMSLNASRLERDGYLFRSRDADDGRVVHLRLTEAGERVREADQVLDPDRVGALLEELSREERARGLDGLELLAAAARRLDPTPPPTPPAGGA
jgi:DNA-binding MarR family transcriptional regulator